MSIHRYDAKTDASQKTIIDALKNAGVKVWHIGRPCDLLLRFYCSRHRDNCWQTLEVKTAYGKKSPKARVDRRQKAQIAFLESTDTPIATDFDSAWRELNKRHALGNIQTACVLKSA